MIDSTRAKNTINKNTKKETEYCKQKKSVRKNVHKILEDNNTEKQLQYDCKIILKNDKHYRTIQDKKKTIRVFFRKGKTKKDITQNLQICTLDRHKSSEMKNIAKKMFE